MACAVHGKQDTCALFLPDQVEGGPVRLSSVHDDRRQVLKSDLLRELQHEVGDELRVWPVVSLAPRKTFPAVERTMPFRRGRPWGSLHPSDIRVYP